MMWDQHMFIYRWIRASMITGCIILGSIAISDVILGGVFRLMHISFPLTNEWLLDNPMIKIDKRYIFADDAMPQRIDGDTYSVAIVGDSFSSCRMEPIICYPEILRRKLQNVGMNVAFYNFSTPGMNTDQEYRVMTEHVLPLKPNMIIWQIYVNDVWENIIHPLYIMGSNGGLIPLDGSQNWAYKRQQFYNAFPWKAKLKNTAIMRALLYMFEGAPYTNMHRENTRQHLVWSLQKIALELASVRSLAEAQDVQIMYILIPPQAVYLAPEQASANKDGIMQYIDVYMQLSKLLQNEKNHVSIRFPPVYEEHPGLLGAAIPTLPVADRYYLHDEDGNMVGDKHLNQEGYQVVADELMNAIHLLQQEP